MIREPLPALDQVELLQQILAELRGLRGDIQTQGQSFRDAGNDPLLAEIQAFIGSMTRFTAAELIDSGDDRLRAAIGGLDAKELGRALSSAEDCAVNGRRLTREPRGAEGNVWRFR